MSASDVGWLSKAPGGSPGQEVGSMDAASDVVTTRPVGGARLHLPAVGSAEADLEIAGFARDVVAQSRANVIASNRAIRRSRSLLTVLYVVLFTVGLGAAVAAIVSGFTAESASEAAGAVVIGGVSAASFFSFFLARPLESLERNAIYTQWLTASVNSYWTRLAYLSDPKTVDDDLEDATRDLVADLRTLARYHAAAIAKAPTPAAPPSGSEDEGATAGQDGASGTVPQDGAGGASSTPAP